MPKLNIPTDDFKGGRGVALASRQGLDPQIVLSCLETPGISAASLQFDALSENRLKRFLKSRPGFKLHAGRAFDQPLSRNILSGTRKMREDFVREFSELFVVCAGLGFASVTLDLGLDSVLDDPEAALDARAIVRGLAPALVSSGASLLLPFRVPSPRMASLKMAAFIRDCMVPGVKVALEAHPHELPRGFAPSDEIRGLEFDVATISFLFRAESGNRLLKAHVEPWFKLLSAYGFQGSLLISPQSEDARNLPAECAEQLKLLRGREEMLI
jgi:hypothetical protein